MSIKKTTKTAIFADGALFIMAFIWGSGFIFMKNSLDNYTALQIISVRMLIGAVVLAFFSIKKILKMNWQDILAGFVISISLFFGFLFQTLGLKTTTAGNSAFLTAIYVVIVPILVVIFAKKRPDKYNVISAVLMLFGIFMLTSKNGVIISLGDIYTIIGSLFFAVQVILIDHYTQKKDPVLMAVLQMFFASLLGFILMLFTGDYPIKILPETIPPILYLGVIGSAVTYLIQNVAQKYTSPTHAGILMSLESVFGCLLGILILGEIMTVKIAAGCIIIFMALIIAETKLKFFKKKKLEQKPLSCTDEQ